MDIRSELFKLQDLKYRSFNAKLIPNIAEESIIGVRMPALRKLAKGISDDERKAFMNDLPHKYLEENTLHAILLNDIKSETECIEELDRFAGYIDNWAVCDTIGPRIFKKNKKRIYEKAVLWIGDTREYAVRLGIGILLQFFLDEDFKAAQAELAASVKSDKYYVNMMIAWYLATALTKQYESCVHIIEEGNLDKWVHNKTIQKAVESCRIPDERKMYLKTLRKR